MIALISFLVAGSVIMAVPVTEECPRIMAQAGLSDGFAEVVAHTIHSLSLEDIRYYFESDATEENGIPTVNMDLDAEKRVLPNAPLIGYDEDFSTMGLKSFDMVMRNMNRTGWQTRNTNILVQIAHVLHMAELWDNTAERYKMVARLLDPESDICACVTDIENNDILTYLHLIAFKLRYPDLSPKRTKRDADPGFGYGYSIEINRRSGEIENIDFDLSDLEILDDVAEMMVEDERAPVPLDSADHWAWWREMVKSVSMSESGYYDIAVFMFCMLN